MAVIDPQSGCVVIRVVYDGAPTAGKTTSVMSLGRGLGAGVYSPADLEGRTLYFDWLDYTGGLFEGRRIRCQIVSVPGQATLAPRRRRLLESADVVVFVGDSSPAGFAADSRYLSGLGAVLNALNGPPVGVVMQANKRDLPDAVPLEELRAMLDSLRMRIGIIESVATEGAGVREAFVFAVRLALDRVRELMRSGDLPSARPRIDSAKDLLEELQRTEEGALALATASGLVHTRMHDVQTSSVAAAALQEAMEAETTPPPVATALSIEATQTAGVAIVPRLPDEHVASGMIWPAVDGRLILHEAAGQEVALHYENENGWLGLIAQRWRVHSAAGASFGDIDVGRAALVQWARMHAASAGVLSKERCIVLAPDGASRFRLWQLVRIERSLRAEIETALCEPTASLASTLLSAIRAFLQFGERMSAAGCELPIGLANICRSVSGPVYAGLMPDQEAPDCASPRLPEQTLDHLFSELAFARPHILARHTDLPREVAGLARSSAAPAQGEWLLLERLVKAA